MAGADPSFTEVHLLRALYILHSGTVGRKRLVKLLGVGEGSVRTIIKRLTAEGLISPSKAGHSLTMLGMKRVSDKLERMGKPASFDSVDLVTGCQSVVIIFGAANRVGDGVILRDVALKAGADGAVIIVQDGGLRFPGTGLELTDYPGAKARLESLGMNDGDIAVIGFASDYQKAEDGAVAVALKLA
jgi:hypothetical protein